MNTAYLAIGIVTLFLTGFMMIYYAYLFEHTDHDVSFFLSVGMISIVMNLFTNMSASAAVLSFVYLVIALAFLGLGFAVSVEGSVAFYTSIGPWFKRTFSDGATLVWKLLSFILSPVGIILFFVFYNSERDKAIICGKAGIWGLLVELLLLWAILGAVSGASIPVETAAASVLLG